VLSAFVVTVAEHQAFSPARLLQRWAEWDAGWYISIATHGYATRAAAGFLPLYPILISLTMHLPGLTPVAAAVLVANVASFGAMAVLGVLAAAEVGHTRIVLRTLGTLAAYPLAYFLVAPFSEGLFLLTIVFALLAARQGWWGWAALGAFLAGLTRPTGVALIVPLLWEYGRQHGWWEVVRRRGRGWRDALRPQELVLGGLVVTAVPLALLCVVVYDWRVLGDPLLYVHVQATDWHHVQWPLWQTLSAMAGNLWHPPHSNLFRLLVVLDIGALVGALILLVVGLRRMPVTFSLYVVAMYVLLLSAPNPTRPEIVPALARYTLVAFPFFLLLGRWGDRHPRLWLALIVAGVAVQVVLATLFLQGWDIE
jgi:hypothetical protein